jgi:hypothetical protein
MRHFAWWASAGCCVVCGSCWAQMARGPNEPPLRGAVTSRGPTVRAVRAGPALIHAFSSFTGGELYVVPSVTGGDTDCASGGTNRAVTPPTPIVADRRTVLHVGAGQVACVAVRGERAFELLWHAKEELVAAPPPFVPPPGEPPPSRALASRPPAPPTLVETLTSRAPR